MIGTAEAVTNCPKPIHVETRDGHDAGRVLTSI